MQCNLFLHIVSDVEKSNNYFAQKTDACGVMGLSAIQKCTAALCIMAYAMPADAVDEYLQLSETSAILSLKKFCHAVVDCYSAQYLRQPTEADTAHLLAIGASQGFPGMLGSLDCMHWSWKNCPMAWQVSTQVRKNLVLLYWKLFLIMSCGSGMPSLACQDLTTILMYLIDPFYLVNTWKARLLMLVTLSTITTTLKGII